MNAFSKKLILAVFIATVIIRLFDVFRPLNQPSWREADLGSISRNFARESLNLFYPRVDWRGETAGFAEMEFPLYPFLIAISYKIFGFNEFQARLINFFFSLASLWFFFRLARSFLDNLALLFAFIFFAFNPLAVELSTTIQPEGLMFMCYLAAVCYFRLWLLDDSPKNYWLAIIFTALAVLGKLTSAHFGLVFFYLVWQKFGVSFYKQNKLPIFAFLSLTPAIIWYFHAKNLWKTYGNSLGVSNETHLIGWDFFTNSYFIKGIFTQEMLYIWMTFGVVVAFFAVWKSLKEEIIRFSLAWLASVFLLYVVICRTSADNWAYYYHIFSLPAASLIFGFGVEKFLRFLRSYYSFFESKKLSDKLSGGLLVVVVSVSLFLTFAVSAKQIRDNFLENRLHRELFECAEKIKPLLKKDGLILASGGTCFDADGFPVAYNASYMFYWLEKKGFNVCLEDQSPEKIVEFSRKVTYFVAERRALRHRNNFEAELRLKYQVVAECDDIIVFDLK